MSLGFLRSQRRTALVLGLYGTLVLTAYGAGDVAAAAAQPAPAAPPGAVRVVGARLFRDGLPWVPRGVQIVGLVAPTADLTGKYVAANAHFGLSELRQARAMHADTVRFQVSEFGLDPNDQLYSSAYVQEIKNAVEEARGLGLTAIVSIQAQSPAGSPNGCPMPDTGTERVWNELAPIFGSDPGVMFELYNEPSLSAGTAGWETWEYGGLVTEANGFSCEAVGIQSLIDEIRGDGADNVIIVPGLGGETMLAGKPPLTDPASPSGPQLAYGIHYPSLTGGSTLWDRKFGAVSATAPVIVTEWDATSTHGCISNEPARSSWLLDYLASKQIGIVGFAFDIPSTIISDWDYTPSSYANFICGIAGDGPGQLLFNEFDGLAQAAGSSQEDPPAWILSYSELERIQAVAPGLAQYTFDTPRTFVTGASDASLQRIGLPAAVPTASFENESKLARAVSQHALPSGTRAVIYDDEDWALTPRGQQRNPAIYYRLAAGVAHSHGLLLIAAPATDLVAALAPRTPKGNTYNEFLQLGIAADTARYADVYDVQAQGTEMNRSKYVSFVRAAAAQAAQAHPDLELLGGISTNPTGRRESSSVLPNAALATQSLVSGYWLNDPARGKACPTCTGPYPSVAIGLLRALRNDGF